MMKIDGNWISTETEAKPLVSDDAAESEERSLRTSSSQNDTLAKLSQQNAAPDERLQEHAWVDLPPK